MRAYVTCICLLVVCWAFLAISFTEGCKPQTPAQAEAAYTAEQLRCVDISTTLAESKACRKQVDEKWGVKR